MQHDLRTPAVPLTHDPLAPLVEDHDLARAVLAAMERAAMRLEVGSPLNVALWRLVLQFFDDYFDGVHHPREDDLLLPLLDSAGFVAAHTAPSRMQQEHGLMSPYRVHLAQAVERRSIAELRSTVRAFVTMHRRHMDMEERHVFPIARAMLSSAERADLRDRFAALERGPAKQLRREAERLLGEIQFMVEQDEQEDGER